MTQSQDHFDEFQEHTLLKHAILDTYLGSWANKLLCWGRAGDTVFFVDAFAGAGHDKAGNPGSPLIAARIAVETQASLRKRPATATAKMRVLAIEKMSGRSRVLAEYLKPFDEVEPGVYRVLRGTLAEHIDEIVRETAGRPTLYFLDPFGLKGLDSATYAKALSGPHNEIFALFADMGASRLHGLVTADSPDVEGQLRALESHPSLFPELDAEAAARIAAAAEEKAHALDMSRPAAREHVSRALGNDAWVEHLAQIDAKDRPTAFVRMFIQRLVQDGAVYVLAIPMRNRDGRRVYTLVHASKSAKGFTAMKEAVSSGLRKETLPENVRRMIREDLAQPVENIAAQLRTAFAEQVVSWTGDVGPTVRGYVLERTGMFDFQLDELKDTLSNEGILRRISRKLMCDFRSPTDAPSSEQ